MSLLLPALPPSIIWGMVPCSSVLHLQVILIVLSPFPSTRGNREQGKNKKQKTQPSQIPIHQTCWLSSLPSCPFFLLFNLHPGYTASRINTHASKTCEVTSNPLTGLHELELVIELHHSSLLSSIRWEQHSQYCWEHQASYYI